MLVHPWVSDGVHLTSAEIIYHVSGDCVCVCGGGGGGGGWTSLSCQAEVVCTYVCLCPCGCVDCAFVDVWMCGHVCVYIEGNGLEVCFHFLVV